MVKRFITGSNVFFSGLEGFKPKDIDSIILVDNPIGFKQVKQVSTDAMCQFYVARHKPEDYIKWYLQTKTPMSAIKFLSRDFCEEVGFTIEHLKQLAPTFQRIDEKHQYAQVVFDAYMANNSFMLTEEQRLKAFEIYKKARK